MSTAADVAVLRLRTAALDPGLRTLYVGARDRMSLDSVRERFRHVRTLDSDRALRPDVLADLDDPRLVLDHFDLIIVPYVLMYLAGPTAALARLRSHADKLLLQENVVRRRPDADPWPDRNRFICHLAPRPFRAKASETALADEKRLVWVAADEVYYYENEGGLSALWEFNR